MKTWIWRLAIVFAFAVVIAWTRLDTAKMEEQLRVLRDDQERVDRLVENLPTMLDIALERHLRKLVAYMESRDD